MITRSVTAAGGWPGTVVTVSGGRVMTSGQTAAQSGQVTAAGLRPGEVVTWFAGPGRQGRWSVLVRLALALPHFLSLKIAYFATWITVIGGWCGALWRGQLSETAGDYLVGYFQWRCRLRAYLLLLTGAYPPIGWLDVIYPADVRVIPGRLNRAAVLTHPVLVLPARLAAVALASGLAVVMPIIWLIVACRGRMPRPAHAAIAAIAGYLAREQAYRLLLTS